MCSQPVKRKSRIGRNCSLRPSTSWGKLLPRTRFWRASRHRQISRVLSRPMDAQIVRLRGHWRLTSKRIWTSTRAAIWFKYRKSVCRTRRRSGRSRGLAICTKATIRPRIRWDLAQIRLFLASRRIWIWWWWKKYRWFHQIRMSRKRFSLSR